MPPPVWYDTRRQDADGPEQGREEGEMRKLAMVSLSFTAGCALCQYLLSPGAMLLAAAGAAVLFLLGFLLRGRQRRAALLLTAAMALSCVYNSVYTRALQGRVAALVGEDRRVTALVTDYAEATASRWRIAAEVEGVSALLYGGEELLELLPGDQVSGVMTVADASVIGDERVTVFTAKGVGLMLYPGEERTVQSAARGSWRYVPQHLARAVGRQIDRLYGGESAGLLKAILLGDRSGLTEGQQSDLSEAGIYHATAVSGMHCGFLLALIAALTGRHRRRLLAAIAIPALILYTLAVGCPASMVRAAVMLILVLLGPLLGRESDPITSLSFALLLLTLQNPMSITGAGLQLSFAAMAGLILVTPVLVRKFPKVRNNILRGAMTTAAASLGAMAFTVPLTAVYFNFLVLIAPLINVLTMWAVTLLFSSGLLAVAVSVFCFPLGQAVSLVGEAGSAFVLGVCRMAAKIPCHALYFDNPYLVWWLIFLLCVVGYCCFVPTDQRKCAMAVVVSAMTLVAVVLLPILERRNVALYAAAIDVGQGACTFLASGGEAVLVDCGSANSNVDAGSEAADALNTWGYFHLDQVILTHYDTDHINGLEVLLARMAVEEILVPLPAEGDEASCRQVETLTEEYGASLRYVTEDCQEDLGTASLTVYAPVGSGSGNEEGLSVLCTAGDFDLLITGDMSAASEAALLERQNFPDIEVLLAGHHGSRSSTGETLLDTVTPEVGIISVGRNSYGHPTDETLQRMVRRDMTIYRTDLQGDLSILVR